jgi:hypothetical protein
VYAPQPTGYAGYGSTGYAGYGSAAAAAAGGGGARQAAGAAAGYGSYAADMYNHDRTGQQDLAYDMQGGSSGGAANSAPLKYSTVNGSPADSTQQMVFSSAGMGLVSTGSGSIVSNVPSLANAGDDGAKLELQTAMDDLPAMNGEDDTVSVP